MSTTSKAYLTHPMKIVSGIGLIALVASIGTLTTAFRPIFHAWAPLAAVLVDSLILALAWWSIDGVRKGQPIGAVRAATHILVGVSVAMQFTVGWQGLGGGTAGVTSAVVHAMIPFVLTVAVELLYATFAWGRGHALAEEKAARRAQTRARRAQEAQDRIAVTLRATRARVALDRPISDDAIARLIVKAARCGALDMARLPAEPTDAATVLRLQSAPKVTARVIAPGSYMSPPSVQGDPVTRPAVTPTMTGRDQAIRDLKGQGVTVKAIAEQVGVSESTVKRVTR